MTSKSQEPLEGSDRSAWSHYWSGLPRESAGCLPGLPRPAALALESLWAGFVGDLPGDALVLDLGTGAGAVPRFSTGVRQDVRWLGVDYVEGLKSNVPNIEYRGGVRMEALPFDDASFDAATSQFSIEYAGASAVAELLRVLKPHAPMMVVAHHSGSVILEQNRRRLAALDDLCSDDGLLALAERLTGTAPDPAPAQDAREALREHAAALQQRHAGQGIVVEAAGFVVGLLGRPQARAELDRVRAEMGMEQLRLRALSRAALDSTAVAALAAALTRPGHPVQVDQVAAPGTPFPLAWALRSG
jgi:hypothetical protein